MRSSPPSLTAGRRPKISIRILYLRKVISHPFSLFGPIFMVYVDGFAQRRHKATKTKKSEMRENERREENRNDNVRQNSVEKAKKEEPPVICAFFINLDNPPSSYIMEGKRTHSVTVIFTVYIRVPISRSVFWRETNCITK